MHPTSQLSSHSNHQVSKHYVSGTQGEWGRGQPPHFFEKVMILKETQKYPGDYAGSVVARVIVS